MAASAMIDEGLGFQPALASALDQHLGQHISGTMSPGGLVDWALPRTRDQPVILIYPLIRSNSQ